MLLWWTEVKLFKNYLCIGKVLLVLTGVSLCCCWAFQLPQLNTSKSFIFHTFIFFGLCLWFARIFWTFLHIFLCQFFCLGFVNTPSFSISLYAFFYICSLVVFTCVRHKFYSIFIWLYYVSNPLFKPCTTQFFLALFAWIQHVYF